MTLLCSRQSIFSSAFMAIFWDNFRTTGGFQTTSTVVVFHVLIREQEQARGVGFLEDFQN
jgi:hypothetical protein